MKTVGIVIRRTWSLAMMAIVGGCIAEIDFPVPDAEDQIVIQGMISTDPGPYEVTVNTALALDDSTAIARPISNSTIKLYDDLGACEDFREVEPGVYETVGSMRGEVGRTYYITVELSDGRVFESEPDIIRPVGSIMEIKPEYEERTSNEEFGEIRADVFNIFVDSDGGEQTNNFVRWRYTGIYRIDTEPKFRMAWERGYRPWKDPPPCSGYIVVPGPENSGGLLEEVGPCECCSCWVHEYEEMPQLSDNQFVTDNQFRNVKVGEVAITRNAFHDKFMVQVEQMSLSRTAYDYYQQLRSQIQGSISIFQPPAGEIIGNITATNNESLVVGLFLTTSVDTETIFLTAEDVPYPLSVMDYYTDDCRLFTENAFNERPDRWEN